MTVETGKVAGRRPLHFSNYDELLDCARKLSQGPTRQLGNWSLGQICKHLAVTIDSSMDGPAFKPPFLLRLVGPLLKKRFLSRPMQSGFKLPKTAGKLLPPETTTADGLEHLERSVARLDQVPARAPHPVFGKLSRDQWDQLQFRHGELHLSFIEPQ